MRAWGYGRPLGYIQCLLSSWLGLDTNNRTSSYFPTPLLFSFGNPTPTPTAVPTQGSAFPRDSLVSTEGVLSYMSFYYCWFLFVLDNCSMAQADLKLTNSPGHTRASLLFVHGPSSLESPGLCEPGAVMIQTSPLYPLKLALQPRLTSSLQPPASASSCWDGKVHPAEASVFLLLTSALKGLLILIPSQSWITLSKYRIRNFRLEFSLQGEAF